VRPGNTPGLLGYIVVALIGGLVVSAAVGVTHPDSELGALGALYLFFWGSVIFFGGLPVLAIGVPLLVVHLTCRGVADQRVHVAGTAVAYLTPLAVAAYFQSGPWIDRLLVLSLAPAMALGRAAVIPLVPGRRTQYPVSPPNTPGVAGYVIGCVISIVVCAPLVVLGSAGFGAMSSVPIVAVTMTVYGAPVTVGAALLLHVLCRRVSSQGAHVAAAALAATFLAFAYAHVSGINDGTLPPAYDVVAIGCAGASGRAAMIPLVIRRRRAVDHDFRPTG
jgi:hypothetical protein